MSKKMNKLVLLSALMIAIIGTFGTVSAEEFDLIAGGGNVGTGVGNVTVSNDTDFIYVEFTTTGDWCMTETHLHIATPGDIEPAAGIPQTKKGNPIPGKFEINEDHDCITEVKYTIPIPDGCVAGDNVIIAAHAVVQLGELDETEESAWGGDVDFPGRNWATYFTYTIA